MTNKPQREQLGFGKAGYIMICKGDTYAYKDWLKEQGACYRKWWGWAFASSIPLPELPAGITAVRIDWAVPMLLLFCLKSRSGAQ